LRLIHAASLLGEGVSVTEAGLAAGYAGTSAFIAAFRKRFGRTPARLREPATHAVAAPATQSVARATARGGPPAHAVTAEESEAGARGGKRMSRRIGFAVLGASDLDRAIAFYRDVIGFPLVRTEPAEDYAELDAGGIGLKVIGGHAPSPPP